MSYSNHIYHVILHYINKPFCVYTTNYPCCNHGYQSNHQDPSDGSQNTGADTVFRAAVFCAAVFRAVVFCAAVFCAAVFCAAVCA